MKPLIHILAAAALATWSSSCLALFGMAEFRGVETYSDWVKDPPSSMKVRIAQFRVDKQPQGHLIAYDHVCYVLSREFTYQADLYYKSGPGFHVRNPRNRTESGKTQEARESSCPSTLNAAMRITVRYADGTAMDDKRVPARLEGGLFNITKFAQELPKKPERIDVVMESAIGEQAPVTQTLQFAAAEFNAMGLDTNRWLPPEVQVDLHMARITAAMVDKRFGDALPSFRALEAQKLEMPESFHYYFIEALVGTGASSEAKERATAYITRFGKRGKYYQEVLQALARI